MCIASFGLLPETSGLWTLSRARRVVSSPARSPKSIVASAQLGTCREKCVLHGVVLNQKSQEICQPVMQGFLAHVCDIRPDTRDLVILKLDPVCGSIQWSALTSPTTPLPDAHVVCMTSAFWVCDAGCRQKCLHEAQIDVRTGVPAPPQLSRKSRERTSVRLRLPTPLGNRNKVYSCPSMLLLYSLLEPASGSGLYAADVYPLLWTTCRYLRDDRDDLSLALREYIYGHIANSKTRRANETQDADE